MKKLLYLSVGLISFNLFAGTASAKEANWSGGYLGGYAGASSDSTDMRDYWCWASCDAPNLQHVSAEAGVQAGINKQVDDNFLLGIEADFGTGATTTVSSPEVPANTPAAFVWTSKYKWKGTARLRAGIVAGKTLAYVTGGVALAKAEFSESSPATAFGKGTPGQPWGARSAGVFTGYVYGFGIEHDLGKVRMKAEFTRTSYGRHTACYMDFAGPTANVCWGSPGTNYNIVSSVPTATSMRIGFNFAF